VGGHQATLATAVGYIQLILFIYMFLGELFLMPFGGLQAMPDVVKDVHQSIQDNKLYFGGAVFLGGLMLSS